MSGDDYGRMIYLVLLLIAVGGWMLAAGRKQIGQMAQQAAIWGFIFLGTIASIGLWNDISNEVAPRVSVVGNTIEIPRSPDGHYHLMLRLNDTPVDFIVDTGASDMVLSLADAARVGLDPSTLVFSGQATTANGIVRTARVRIPKVEIGGSVETNVPASVTEGDMDGSLLGMSYLQRFGRIEISGNRMTLER